MWNHPTAKQLATLPTFYSTENIPLKDKVIYMHFFFGGCDWYVAEFDGEDTFFGLVEGHCKEFGYFSLSELESLRGPLSLPVERDLYWQPKTLEEIAPELFTSIDSQD